MALIQVICVGICSAETHWLSPGQSIQVAVTGAADGDTLLLEEGAYMERVVLHGKLLTIASRFLLDGDTVHIGQTVVTADTVCPDTNSCFVYCYGEPSGGRLVGLTLSGGRGTYLTPFNGTTGGNVVVFHASVDIEHCRFADGMAYFGGDLFVNDYLYGVTNVCRVRNCLFTGCKSETWGGAVYANRCSLDVALSVFDNDTAGATGGGLWVAQSYVAIDSCRIQRCYGQIGGLYVIDSRGDYVRNTVFEENGNSGTPLACHLQVSNSYVTVARCTFRNNSVHQIPIELLGGYAPVRFVGNVVEDNQAIIRTGILQCGSDALGEIAYNIFRNNVTSHGGTLVAFDNARPRVHHNVFDGNISFDSTFGAVFISVSNGRPVIDSNIIVHHRPPIFSVRPAWPQTIDARYNWWGHPSGPYDPVRNPEGQGDTLLCDSVIFIPWLTEPPDTSMPPGYLTVDRHARVPTTWHLLNVYPNPFNSIVRIELAGFTGNDFELTLHNLLGQIVDVVERGPVTGGALTYTAPPSLASGIYFLKASDRHAVMTKKVVLLK